MGKNRNKNKKIHKQRQQQSSTKAQHKKIEKEDEQVIQANEENINQQFKQHEGIFQQFANQNQNAMENEGDRKQQNKSAFLEKCSLGHGYLFILQVGKCYKIFNNSTINSDISIIDGVIDINGRIFKELFFVKAEHNIIIETKSIKNQKQSVSKDIQIVKNKKQQIKTNKKKTKMSKQINNSLLEELNKNVKYIFEKIAMNKQVMHLISKQMENQSNISQQSLKLLLQMANQKILSYFHDYEQEQNALIWCQSSDVQISLYEKSRKPWQGIDPKKYIGKGETSLLIGPKNTGKTMFCNYLQNIAQSSSQEICILDLDIGRNRTYPGCVSFLARDSKGKTQQISIWVGQFTPLNSIPVYINAISSLYNYYKEKYFTSSLVVNTMGYLSGVGELILYQIFNILKPQKVLFMEGPQNQQHYLLNNVRNGISSGSYIDRLYFQNVSNSTKTSTKIQKYTNFYADQKSAPSRFQSLLTRNTLRNIEDLLMMILGRKLIQINKHLQMYKSNKTGKYCKIQQCNRIQTDMRIILLGKIWGTSELFSMSGVGYGLNGLIFCDPSLIDFDDVCMGLISDGIDFQRNFYQISQSRIIQIQEVLGYQLPYIYPNFRALGNKGMRNNPGKKITGIQQ